MIRVKTEHLGKDVDIVAYAEDIERINQGIDARSLPGNDYLGWAKYPENYDKEEFERILKAADYIRNEVDTLVVAGIGGSYLGARAAIEGINGLYGDNKVEIIFFGHTMSGKHAKQILRKLEGKRFAINVISKSGTTTETAVAFRLLRDLLEKNVGKEEARKLIFATTDKEKGALLGLCKKYGYERFVLPGDIGGRYSVFTAVGLLPLAVAGIDIRAFMDGAKNAMLAYDSDEINEAYKYAILRHVLYKDYGYSVEMLVNYGLHLVQLGEWWKQLFGESEGKEKTGLLPDSAVFTTDLHSLGQFIQEGSPVLFETVILEKDPEEDVLVPHDEDDLDGLNYLEGKGLNYVNSTAAEATLDAHSITGGVPNILIEIDRFDAFGMGELMYFFMRACAAACYLNEINPFNQPGVEVYKKNMFHRLGKPGY